ncbi:MAG: sigma-54 dependent transcriptional regulator [Planctomycetota bacterium]
MELIQTESYDIVVTDLRMPEHTGLDVIRKVKDIAPDTEVIMITGFGTMENAIAALKAGAADFLAKPLEFETLQLAIEKALRLNRITQENADNRTRLDRHTARMREVLGSDTFMGVSAEAEEVRALIAKAAAIDTAVLLTGASGTGKELAATQIHCSGPRSRGPFITVNCSGFTPTLIESELFGHEKGAFTGAETQKKGVIELADRGTLFLDEIGDMPANLQSRLLRVIEEKEHRRVGGQKAVRVDFRLIAATNRDLAALVASGDFRQDLYYRISGFTIPLPPLCGRKDDIDLLAAHLLGYLAGRMRRAAPALDPAAAAYLRAYPFPGNVRELRNMLDRALILCEGDVITMDRLAAQPHKPGQVTQSMPKLTGTVLDTLNLDVLENLAVKEAMARADGNAGRAAEMLGISRYALMRKVKKNDPS